MSHRSIAAVILLCTALIGCGDQTIETSGGTTATGTANAGIVEVTVSDPIVGIAAVQQGAVLVAMSRSVSKVDEGGKVDELFSTAGTIRASLDGVNEIDVLVELGGVFTIVTVDARGSRAETSPIPIDPSRSTAYEFDRVGSKFVVVAKLRTSSAFSAAELFTSNDSGRSWTAQRGPAYGRPFLMNNQLWIHDLVNRARLYRSSDEGLNWGEETIESNGLTEFAAVARYPGGLAALVTERSSVESDADSFSVRVRGPAGWRERANLSDIPAKDWTLGVLQDRILLISPSSRKLVNVTETVSRGDLIVHTIDPQLSPAGLLTGSGNSVAGLFRSGLCADKTNCTSTDVVLVSRDRGTSWDTLARYATSTR